MTPRPLSHADRALLFALFVLLFLAAGPVLLGAAPDIAAALAQRLSPSPTDIAPDVPAWSARALVLTLCVAAVIAALSTLIAAAAAWSLRAARPAWTALAIAPLLMPVYLAYSGWSAFRGPGTLLGDWIAAGPPARSLAAASLTAILGLSLWAWPLALITIAPAVRVVPADVLAALALDAPAPIGRGLARLRLVRRAVLAGFSTVFLIMLGSAVPLHLAQVPTLAVHLWTYLSLTPTPGPAYLAAAPLLLLAAIAGILLARNLRAGARPSDEASAPAVEAAAPRWPRLVMLAWLASVAAPILAQLIVRQDVDLLFEFWRTLAGAAVESLQTAAWVGLASAALCITTARAVGLPGWPRRLARVAVAVTVFLALLPGILVGHAVLAATLRPWTPDWFDRSTAPVVMAHIARFGVLGVLAGWWLARLEPAALLDTRRLDDPGLRAWLLTVLARWWGVPVCAALAAGALSLHEIESAVLLTPPGLGSLSQRTLELLHYARDRQLASALVNMGLVGVLASLLTGLLAARTVRTFPTPSSPTL